MDPDIEFTEQVDGDFLLVNSIDKLEQTFNEVYGSLSDEIKYNLKFKVPFELSNYKIRGEMQSVDDEELSIPFEFEE